MSSSSKGKGVEDSEATYIYNGKNYKVEPYSLFVLGPNSFLRRVCFQIGHHKLFENLIFLAILANSIIFATVDYSYVNEYGELSPVGSLGNEIYFKSNYIFVLIFLVECILKIISLGFIGNNGSYLSDAWNWLDFVVVVTGTLSIMNLDLGRSVSVIRTLRVLRPLRTVNAMPSLQRIVNSILTSIPHLGSVFILLGFLFTIYGISGVQLFSGNYFHSRCRATPFPVTLDFVPYSGMDYNQHKCLSDAINFNLPSDRPQWNKHDSPWSNPQDCYWPLATRFVGIFGRNSTNADPLMPPYTLFSYDSVANSMDKIRFCSYDTGEFPGNYRCIHDDDKVDPYFWSWCGSSYDGLGNNRFTDKHLAKSDLFEPDLFYGYINFDNLGMALINIFQVITMEGWTANMYLMIDAYNSKTAVFYYCSLVLIGACFVVQLLLAVLEDSFNMVSQEQRLEKMKEENKKKLLERSDSMSTPSVKSSTAFNSLGGLNFNKLILEAKILQDADEILKSSVLMQCLDKLHTIFIGKPLTAADRGNLGLPITLDNPNSGMSDCRSAMELKACALAIYLFSGWRDWKLIKGVAYIFDLIVPDKEHPARKNVGAMLATNQYEFFSAFLIFFNCIIMSLDHYPATYSFLVVTEGINLVLTLIFTLELLLKFWSHGIYAHLFPENGDLFNIFDSLVVVSSVLDMAVDPPYLLGGQNAGKKGIISLLRCFRLFRLIKFIIKFENVRLLLGRVAATFMELQSFMVLLLLFLFIFALLGMQLFANKFRFNEAGEYIPFYSPIDGNEPWKNAYSVSRYTFDDFNSAFASSFQIMSTENWNNIMIDVWRSSGVTAIGFPFAIIIIGSYILMNLYLAILLNTFSKKLDEGASDVSDDSDDVTNLDVPNPDNINDIISINSNSSRNENTVIAVTNKKPFASISDNESGTNSYPVDANSFADNLSSSSKVSNRAYDSEHKNLKPDDQPASSNNPQKDESSIFPLDNELSLYLFGPANWLRLQCANVISSKYFDNTVLTLIIISSVTLAVDSPLLNPNSETYIALRKIDIVMTFLFTIECAIKVITFGFIFPKNAYLRNGWNILDFSVVIISQISLFTDGNAALKSLKAFRSMRALRPLRMINRAPGLKILVNSMINAIPDVLNVFVVFLLVLSIFSVIFVSFLKGDLRACQGILFDDQISSNADYLRLLENPPVWGQMTLTQKELFGPMSPFSSSSNDLVSVCSNEAPPYSNWYSSPSPCCPSIHVSSSASLDDYKMSSKDVCLCWGAQWKPTTNQLMDSFPSGVLSLMQISTTEGWVDLMYAAVDSTGIDSQPIRNSKPQYFYLFIFYMVVSNFFALNLFVGVLLDNFKRQKEHHAKSNNGSHLFMTDAQFEWVKTQEVINKISPNKRYRRSKDNRLRAFLFDIVTNHHFEYLIMLCILCNTVVLSMTHFGESHSWSQILENLNLIFSFVFSAEAILKIGALGKDYFHGFWNLFDFVLIIGTNVGIVLYFLGNNSLLIVTVARLFRVFRVVRLLSGFRTTKKLFNAIILTIPSLGNITALLMLFIYMYAVLGVQLFAFIHFNGLLDQHANFRTFGDAIRTLVRFATGESWANFMSNAAQNTEYCSNNEVFHEDSCDNLYYNNLNYFSSDFYINGNTYTQTSFAGFERAFTNVPCRPINGCGSIIIFPYLYSYTLIVTICLFNLFVGIVIEGFQDVSGQNNSTISPEQIDEIVDHWTKFDHDATYYVTMTDFEIFMRTLIKPFGFGESINKRKDREPKVSQTVLTRRIRKMKLSVMRSGASKEPMVHFRDVLMALSTEAMERELCESFTDIRHTIGKTMIFQQSDFEFLNSLVVDGLNTTVGGITGKKYSLIDTSNQPRQVLRHGGTDSYTSDELYMARLIYIALKAYAEKKRFMRGELEEKEREREDRKNRRSMKTTPAAPTSQAPTFELSPKSMKLFYIALKARSEKIKLKAVEMEKKETEVKTAPAEVLSSSFKPFQATLQLSLAPTNANLSKIDNVDFGNDKLPRSPSRSIVPIDNIMPSSTQEVSRTEVLHRMSSSSMNELSATNKSTGGGSQELTRDVSLDDGIQLGPVGRSDLTLIKSDSSSSMFRSGLVAPEPIQSNLNQIRSKTSFSYLNNASASTTINSNSSTYHEDKDADVDAILDRSIAPAPVEMVIKLNPKFNTIAPVKMKAFSRFAKNNRVIPSSGSEDQSSPRNNNSVAPTTFAAYTGSSVEKSKAMSSAKEKPLAAPKKMNKIDKAKTIALAYDVPYASSGSPKRLSDHIIHNVGRSPWEEDKKDDTETD